MFSENVTGSYKFDHVMLDIETTDNIHTANIISIGAVRFDKSCPDLQQEFYAGLDLQDGASYGLTTGADTMAWWDKKSPEAREVFNTPGRLDLRTALTSFNAFVGQVPNTKVWGNGVTFDNTIVRNAFKAVQIEPCWNYQNDMCFRTMLRNFFIKRINFGVAHNALDDAKSQALTLIRVWELIKNGTHPKIWGEHDAI
jgi:hypothetical protein